MVACSSDAGPGGCTGRGWMATHLTKCIHLVLQSLNATAPNGVNTQLPGGDGLRARVASAPSIEIEIEVDVGIAMWWAIGGLHQTCGSVPVSVSFEA